MSLFGAMSTAVSGLGGQAAAFGDISDDVANSQTVGFKRVDTAFTDYLTTSTAATNNSGAVVATPRYINTVQGTVTQTDNPLALAIDGQGFFQVSKSTGTDSGQVDFSNQKYYTRTGDFQLDSSGYVVNSAGEYLNGWSVNAAGAVERSTIAPIQVKQSTDQPVPTGAIAISANLPPGGGATPATPSTSPITVYDALGQPHQVTLSFTASTTAANTWALSVADDKGNTIGNATVAFGSDGTLASVAAGGTTTTTGAATVPLATAYPASGGGNQTISLQLGTIGSAGGLTQFGGTVYTLNSLTQDGLPPGSFTNITTTAAGDIVANYDNGASKTIAKVPIIDFAAPDALQRQNGQSFTATQESGVALANDSGSGGAGSLVTSSVEASNVDISTEFTSLIVAQQAYSANAKVITSANDLLQTTINIIR